MTDITEREARRILEAAREEGRRLVEESRRQALELHLAAEQEALALRQSSALESAELFAEAEQKATEVLFAARRVEEAVRVVREEYGRNDPSPTAPADAGETTQDKEVHMYPVDESATSPGDVASLDYLAKELRRLTLSNQELQGALDLANRRVAFYERFDDSFQDAWAQALRAAYEIRAKAEREAKDLLDRARSEEVLLKGEIERLRVERTGLIEERYSLLRAVEEARVDLDHATLQRDGGGGEKDRILSEVLMLESRLRTIRDDLESLSTARRPAAAREAVENPARDRDIDMVPPVADVEVRRDFLKVVAPAAIESPAPGRPPVAPVPRVPIVADEPLSIPASEIPDVGQPTGAVVQHEARREKEPAPPPPVEPEEPSTEFELVVSPVHSFPRLVEFERALESVPGVKSFYVRDFRHGVATLLLRLTKAEVGEDLAARLESLPDWNLVVLNSPPHKIEAKIGA